MKLKIAITLLAVFFCCNWSQANEWYVGGTLHNATVKEFCDASPQNRLATAADWNEYDRRVNSLLSGLEKILSSIAEMRNKGSDAHGLGAKRIKIKGHIARLYVNSSATMADFILAVYERKVNDNSS